MSDFTSNFWSVFVAGVTVISIIACLILLVITARKKVASTADNTTGHVWDEDLTEMNNPMPRWWMWLFVITIVFGFLETVPKLVFLLVLYFLTRYVLKMIKLYFHSIADGKIVLPEFDADWAWPTYRLVRLLLVPPR